MNRWIKIGAAIVALAAVVWVFVWVINLVVSIVITIAQIAIALAVVAAILYGAYLLISKFSGGSSGSRGTERERIFE